MSMLTWMLSPPPLKEVDEDVDVHVDIDVDALPLRGRCGYRCGCPCGGRCGDLFVLFSSCMVDGRIN